MSLRQRSGPDSTLSPESQEYAVSSGKEGESSSDSAAAVQSDAQPAEAPEPTVLLAQSTSKYRNMAIRGLYTFLMIGGFLLILWLGHVATALLVLFLQFQMFREVVFIQTRWQQTKRLTGRRPLTGSRALKWMNWLGLAAAIFYCYGRFLAPQLRSTPLRRFADYHAFYSFALYMAGFVGFVLSLQRGKLRAQFSQFAYMHMVLLLVVVFSSAHVRNIFEGLIWFVLPCSMIIANDIFAYLFGFFFGRTPLIPTLSPKKTWEGFIGATFATVVYGFFVSRVMAQYACLVCPQPELRLFSGSLTCEVPYVFKLEEYTLPFGTATFHLLPIQIHAIIMALFASIVGPFGGFFASGFKRAIGVKDFGDSIPGHGGVTDRMDCQTIMGFFSYIYFVTFVRPESQEIDVVMGIIEGLGRDHQMQIYELLGRMLGVA